MIPVEEARARILAPLAPVGTEIVPIAQAHGRVLAAPVHARLSQPAHDVSAMDGYAVRAHEPGPLRVIGHAPAGHPFAGQVGPGEAVRLFTGSVLPAGAESVVIQEDTEREGDTLRLAAPAEPGRHIRRAGQDFTTGTPLLSPGRRLNPREIGLAAAANHPWLRVHRRPRVAILATGDEIAMPGDPIAPGGLVSSNSLLLAALFREAGADPTLLPVAPDDRQAIAAAAAEAQGFDLLVTTGGASVGEHDLVQAGLAGSGFTLDFWKVAMRPGKPMISGRIGALPLIGLPGNPVSAAVCAVLFVRPAIARLAGLAVIGPETQPAILGAPLRANDSRADHLRAALSRDAAGRLVATPFDRQDSSLLRLLAEAGALVLRPPHAPAATPGDPIEIIPL